MFMQPLEQFEVYNLFNFWDNNTIEFLITNMLIYMILICSVMLFFYTKASKVQLLPTAWQHIYESFYKFLMDVLKGQSDIKGIKFYPYIYSVFFFILLSNLLGLIPYSFTVTSHIFVTFTLGFSTWLGLVFLGFMEQSFKFLLLFVPTGVPLVLIPLLVCIEVVSYMSRAFSLSMSLFANLMAGHALLHMLASFSGKLLKNKFLMGCLVLMLVIAIVFLEVGIAFLQAYVFVVLICTYLNDSYHSAH